MLDPRKTTKEAVTKAFKQLRKDGYFARQNWKCCQSCGWYAVPDEKGDKAVFYHAQDRESFNRNGDLYLAWSGDGNLIKQRLEEAGLQVKWDGSDKHRILVESQINPC